MMEYFTEEVIKSASENSSGTLLDETAIGVVIEAIINNQNLSKSYVDKMISENETEGGYMTKFSDFNYALKDFLSGDQIQDSEHEKPEKDYEEIEALYGEWHAEVGDR